ncbi:MAG: DUF4129 domain-containing protein [Pyrinomonadaceae bacterium]
MNTAKRRFIFKNYPVSPVYLAVFFLSAYLLFFPHSIFARTLTKYRGSVHSAKLSVENLLAPDSEDKSFKDYLKLERATLAEIRAEIPPTERIEWRGTTIETDNRWLLDELERLPREPLDSPKREAILNETDERLAALEQKLGELENPSVSNHTKDEDKRKLAEILRREEFQKPEEKQESLFAKLYRKIIAWLAKMFPRPNLSDSSSTDGFQSFSFVLQMLLYALVLGAIGFLIYRFAPFFLNRLRLKKTGEKRERVILGERLAADETAETLFDEAERLAREGNWRGAIRKGYIALLCELSERKIIGLSRHKTNRDYLRDIRKRGDLYENMNGLTLNYERHWYGFDEAAKIDWEDFRNDYKKAVGN